MQQAERHEGTAILKARNALNMSLAELADRSGKSAGYISRVERGERVPTKRWLSEVTGALFRAMAEEAS